MTSAEKVAEGDYEHFMKTPFGHVVILMMLVATVLYIRLLGFSMFPKVYAFGMWLCCCDDDDDDDEGNEENVNSSQLDSSTCSQTPINRDIELGSSHNANMQQHLYQDNRNDAVGYHESGAEYYNEEQDDTNYENEGSEGYQQHEAYYNDQYVNNGHDHDEYYSNDQCYGNEDNASANFDEYAYSQHGPNTHNQFPQPQHQTRTSTVPVSSRRSQAPDRQSTMKVVDTSNSAFQSSRKPRVHPSRR